MVHPGIFIGFLVAKKAVAVTVYYGLKRYGFNRTYRRLLEANKRLTPVTQQKLVQNAIKTSFYFPGKAVDYLQKYEIITFMERLSKELKGKKGPLGTIESYLSSILISSKYTIDLSSFLQKEVDSHNPRTGNTGSSSSPNLKGTSPSAIPTNNPK
jgi:hypothetical protein